MSEWISVKDRLPEGEKCAALLFYGGRLEVGYMSSRTPSDAHYRDYHNNSFLANMREVTHWMSLPEPPNA